jgi:O-acetyl-ADP-ribose deacetylase (regulator of RNase III)
MFWPFQFHPAGPRVVRLMRGDIARCEAEAIAVSANPYLEGTLRSNYWRFSGRRNADGAVRLAGGRSLADATARVSARHPNLRPIELPMR